MKVSWLYVFEQRNVPILYCTFATPIMTLIQSVHSSRLPLPTSPLLLSSHHTQVPLPQPCHRSDFSHGNNLPLEGVDCSLSYRFQVCAQFFPSITKKNNWSWNVGISFASFYHWFWPIRSTVSHGFIDCLLLFYWAPLPTQDTISWHTFTKIEQVLTLPWLQLKTNTLFDFQSWYWAQRFASKERRPHNLDQVRF